MHIGIPTEVKQHERRVALTPPAVAALVQAGHTVFVQAGAGVGAGFSDADYTAAGAQLAADAAALYDAAALIVKVKEPQPQEFGLLKAHHTLFGYLHLAAAPAVTAALEQAGCTAVAFETVVVDGKTPLLAPMSAIAGRLSIQIATWLLHAPRGGRGVLLGGIPGVGGGRVTVLGAGVAGREAATLAHHMGAQVTVLDLNPQRLDELAKALPGLQTEVSSPMAIAALLPQTDVLVGSVYVHGKRAPVVVTEAQVQTMPAGSVVVDISIDQGGCIATAQPCTHSAPSYVAHGVLHSCITNMPAAAPHTASVALAQAILPYVHQLAAGDWTPALQGGINVQSGRLKISL